MKGPRFAGIQMCEVLKGGGSVENLDRTAKGSMIFVKQFV